MGNVYGVYEEVFVGSLRQDNKNNYEGGELREKKKEREEEKEG